jgi:hypothetical protein
MSDAKGHVLLLSKLILAPDPAGGGINMYVAALEAKPRRGLYKPRRSSQIPGSEYDSHRKLG